MIARRSSAPKLPPGFLRRQNASSPPTIERQLALELALGGVEEARHPAEMIVMTVAQHHGVEHRRIDLQDRHVVVAAPRACSRNRSAHGASRRRGMRFRVHREAPFAVQRRARRRVRRGVAAGRRSMVRPPRFSFGHELDHDVVGDHSHRQPVHLRHLAAERRGLRGARGRRPCAPSWRTTKPAPPEQSAPSEPGPGCSCSRRRASSLPVVMAGLDPAVCVLFIQSKRGL